MAADDAQVFLETVRKFLAGNENYPSKACCLQRGAHQTKVVFFERVFLKIRGFLKISKL